MPGSEPPFRGGGEEAGQSSKSFSTLTRYLQWHICRDTEAFFKTSIPHRPSLCHLIGKPLMLMTPLRIIFLGKNKNTVVQYPPLCSSPTDFPGGYSKEVGSSCAPGSLCQGLPWTDILNSLNLFGSLLARRLFEVSNYSM